MSFLQPLMLFALPLIALPIVIHLINQWRYRTIRWGAMMFLRAANRMSRGYARIRQWLILAARTLAIAGLLFAISRPLASGWLSLAAGGNVDTTIVIFDRSPSMLERGPNGGKSKLESGRDQIIHSLSLLGSNRWVLIDQAGSPPVEIESLDALSALVPGDGVSASTDLPAMLQSAFDYVQKNRPSRTEIWICSDVRQHDWAPESGRWQAIRDAFLALPLPVRFHLLAYPDVDARNRAIRVTDVRRSEGAAGAELLLSLRIDQAVATDGKETIPVRLEIDGARSEIDIELTGTNAEIKNHSIPLDGQQAQGWGRVSIPADANPSDNEFYFVYQQPPSRKTVVVAGDAESVGPLQLAASISSDPSIQSTVETIQPQQVTGIDWSAMSLVLWQADLPEGEIAKQVQSFLDRGGEVIFFPPVSPTSTEFAGVRWKEWQVLAEETPVAGWTGDQDLLARTRSGTSLPVGELRVARFCELSGEHLSLATLAGGAPLLCRTLADGAEGAEPVATDLRESALVSTPHAYLCATTASAGDSSLARNGIVLYVMIQRALAAGAAMLGTARQYDAGSLPEQATSGWKILSEGDAVPSAYGNSAGVYQDGQKLFAINRSGNEDKPAIVADARVAGLFQQLDFDRIDDRAGGGTTLLAEVWRLFMILMMAALLVEALLCVPRIVRPGTSETPRFIPAPTANGAAA